jgi:hypothetical protein
VLAVLLLHGKTGSSRVGAVERALLLVGELMNLL